MIRAVAFDVMDTLLSDPFRAALEAATGLSLQQLMTRRDPEVYPAFERGEISESLYWEHHAELGVEVDPAAFHAVRRTGTRWLPGMEHLLAELDGVVLRVGASNYPVWIEELIEGPLAGRLDRVLASCHLGARKPDHAFYDRLLARLGLPAASVAFVDDREVNVVAAREVGMASHLVAGEGLSAAVGVRRYLADLGVPIAREAAVDLS
ncbi:MAG: haloacid dehalogenase [Nitriliruptor sp.]|nr:MAG: haloacid dehalogenase [Nitriliruptor sp.]